MIVTTYDPKPIPIRRFDWEASDSDGDENSPIGFGATKADALIDLTEKLLEQRQDDREHYGDIEEQKRDADSYTARGNCIDWE